MLDYSTYENITNILYCIKDAKHYIRKTMCHIKILYYNIKKLLYYIEIMERYNYIRNK